MLRIALCDDEKHELGKTAVLLERYLLSRPSLSGKAEVFQNGEALLTRAEEVGGFDLYILDILMPGLSGIDTGRRLRTLGDGGEIVYLTSSNDFAADSYEVGAFFYLLKPVSESSLFKVLDSAVEKLERRRNVAIVVTTANGQQRLLLERIRYAERVGRCIRYYCTDGTVDSQTIRVPFREAVATLLADRRFCLCGASFVLNFQHVAAVQGRTAMLDNGQTVELPRASATEFKKAWGKFWLEEKSAW